eukprot:1457505-Karenia_brevis.AAC.1
MEDDKDEVSGRSASGRALHSVLPVSKVAVSRIPLSAGAPYLHSVHVRKCLCIMLLVLPLPMSPSHDLLIDFIWDV